MDDNAFTSMQPKKRRILQRSMMFNFFDNAATILSLPSWIRRPKTPCKEKRFKNLCAKIDLKNSVNQQDHLQFVCFCLRHSVSFGNSDGTYHRCKESAATIRRNRNILLFLKKKSEIETYQEQSYGVKVLPLAQLQMIGLSTLIVFATLVLHISKPAKFSH